MKREIFIALILLTSIAVFFTGCNSKNSNTEIELTDFTYSFSMENTGNFRVELVVNNDSTYNVKQQNMFFDRYAKSNNDDISEGKLTEDEFVKLKSLLENSDIYNLNDSYGFDENSDNSTVYTINLTEGEKTKFVVINAEANQGFSKEFTDLFEYSSAIMSKKLSN